MPAYSQSTIRIRVPSSMKFALSRSLWHGRSSIGASQAGQLDPPADRRREVVGGRDADAAGQRQRPVGLDDAERHEQARDRRAVVDAAERIRDAAERLRLVDGLVRHRRALDEAGHEVALGPDEGGDLRPHADPGRRDRRGMLHLPGDPEQVGVVAGQADDPALGRSRPRSTRKLRFVIPPESAVSVRSRPASSGTRRAPRRASSRSSPAELPSGSAIGDHAATPIDASPVAASASTCDRVELRRGRRRVVDRRRRSRTAPDQGLEDRPSVAGPSIGLPADLDRRC